MSDEQYIPNTRDAIVAYFGRNTSGNLRCYCVRCHDESPLADAHKVYGDLDQPEPLAHGRGSYGSWDTCDQCEVCWVSLLDLSRACQREHDEQQARWSRLSAPRYTDEMGARSAIRCRVY